MSNLILQSGTFSMIGARPTMEDEHIAIDDLQEDYPDLAGGNPFAYYGIYDGHRGIRAAEYAAEYLHINIIEHPDFLNDTKKAIHEAFIQTDNNFLKKAASKDEKWHDGCTVVVAIFVNKKLYVANCGDAEILLGRKSEDSDSIEAIELTHKHKPSDPQEKERIKKEGGIVLAGRVGGALAVARAFGDLEFKTPFSDGDLKIGKLIIPDPHITSIDLIPERDLFLIIGCDGVWERLTHKDSVKFVGKHIQEEGPDVTSEMLVNKAFSAGSQDNISSTIVNFTWENQQNLKNDCNDTEINENDIMNESSEESTNETESEEKQITESNENKNKTDDDNKNNELSSNSMEESNDDTGNDKE